MPVTIPDETLESAGLPEREMRIEVACRLFDAGKLALWPAAKLAEMSRVEFEGELGRREIFIYRPTVEDFVEEMAALKSAWVIDMAIVVGDTSPIRALAHLGLVDLLRDLYLDVLVPPAVDRELRNPASGQGTVDVAAFPFIRIRGPRDRAIVSSFARGLDPGESEAIALALEVGSGLILIDESAGRTAAARAGSVPVGVLGTLGLAKQRGLTGEIAPPIDRLRRETRFFVSEKPRATVIRTAGEVP